jgi:hypothetical protein
MERGKAFLVVGHKHWGKSRTLKALADESFARYISIADKWLFIRRMSNDDKPDEFRDLVRTLNPVDKENVILAFCPVFDEGDAEATLRDLHRHYNIFSFVIRHAFDRKRQITGDEIAALRHFGDVELFEEYGEASDRADSLRIFIEQHLLAGHIA